MYSCQTWSSHFTNPGKLPVKQHLLWILYSDQSVHFWLLYVLEETGWFIWPIKTLIISTAALKWVFVVYKITPPTCPFYLDVDGWELNKVVLFAIICSCNSPALSLTLQVWDWHSTWIQPSLWSGNTSTSGGQSPMASLWQAALCFCPPWLQSTPGCTISLGGEAASSSWEDCCLTVVWPAPSCALLGPNLSWPNLTQRHPGL